ncbi:MAG: SAM-dependent methyltransferase, partial [Chloroflexi bacterium]|nr:SAM-dependent methyltransferase [Chloroflexota bacterium]
TYLGFLPRKSSERRRRLASVAGETRSIVAFESPHRLLSCLADIQETLGDRPTAVGRELTKLHEEFVRGTVSEVRDHFLAHAPRGEFTLVIGGAPKA